MVAAERGDGEGDRGASASPVEELHPGNFKERVIDAVNDTDSGVAEYYPFVFFHVPWCEYCKKTMPEFETAAEKVAKVSRKQPMSEYNALPRFFTFDCSSVEAQKLCKAYVSGFPNLMLFREGRQAIFNRPRSAGTIVWWVTRVSRPPLMEFRTQGQMSAWSMNEPVFLLRKRAGKDDVVATMAWVELGYRFIDVYTFAVVPEGSTLCKSLPGRAPSVHLEAPSALGLRPLKFTGEVTPERLEHWVVFNQFPPLVTLTPWTVNDIGKTGLTVVALAHSGGAADEEARKAFKRKVITLREESRYLFGTINATDEDAGVVLSRAFPVISAPPTNLPKIFAFSGSGKLTRYWEDPRLTRPEDLTIERISTLLRDAEALQDDTWGSWMKGKRKIYLRFASSSVLAFSIAVILPVAVVGGCMMWCRALCAKEDDPGGPHEHAD